jgi:hypothetical protein
LGSAAAWRHGSSVVRIEWCRVVYVVRDAVDLDGVDLDLGLRVDLDVRPRVGFDLGLRVDFDLGLRVAVDPDGVDLDLKPRVDLDICIEHLRYLCLRRGVDFRGVDLGHRVHAVGHIDVVAFLGLIRASEPHRQQ